MLLIKKNQIFSEHHTVLKLYGTLTPDVSTWEAQGEWEEPVVEAKKTGSWSAWDHRENQRLNDAEHKESKSSTPDLRRRGIIGKDTKVKQELAAWPARCYA